MSLRGGNSAEDSEDSRYIESVPVALPEEIYMEHVVPENAERNKVTNDNAHGWEGDVKPSDEVAEAAIPVFDIVFSPEDHVIW